MQPSSDFPTDLVDTLRQRLSIIANHSLRDRDPQEHLAQLKAVSERLEVFAASVPPDTDPQFLHYLQRRSYDKALAWLTTRS